MRASLEQWKSASRLWDIVYTRAAGPHAIERARLERFASLVRFARKRSPFYGNAYRTLPDRDLRPSEVPIVTRPQLMAHFDDWVTDTEVTFAGVAEFIDDRTHIGQRFLGRYVVWKSSGTSGSPGLYVQDSDGLATFDALMAAHLDPARFVGGRAWDLLRSGNRAALVAATGEHFASIASWQRLCRGNPWISARSFSILTPLPELVEELNHYRPDYLASYPTMLALLAEEQQAGRLHIHPNGLWSGGECLSPDARWVIDEAFHGTVVNEYGSSECMSMAFGCTEGWLHVNSDWVVLEPVDRHYQPTPAGEASHTVLLTNLANRVQPIIRYDLGDSIVVNPEPCPCGNSLPAIQVQGRRDDVLALHTAQGAVVRLLPLALTTVVEEASHVHRFQIVQTAADCLALRLPLDQADRQAAGVAAKRALRFYLDQQSLGNVQVTVDERGPSADPRSGKLKEVLLETST